MIYHLYAIRLPTDDYRIAYVGATKLPTQRLKQHFRSQLPIGEAIRLCGIDSVIFEILESNDDREHIYQRESETVAALNTRWPNGYNIAPGGSGGRDPLPSTRAKMSAAQRNRSPEINEKIAAAHRGKKRTLEARERMTAAQRKPEQRAKLSATSRGRKHSPKTRALLSAILTGIKRSPETCAKLASIVQSPETRAKISAAGRGRKQSTDSVAKRAEKLRGQKRSADTCAKISAAKLEGYARRRSEAGPPPPKPWETMDVSRRTWYRRVEGITTEHTRIFGECPP